MISTTSSLQPQIPDTGPITHVDISQIVYERIREMIMRGDFVPGSKIDVGCLAESFQVSRTTVANALQRLALEDLVYIVPRRGTYVQRFALRQLWELYDVRLCLELWAAKHSVESASVAEVFQLRQLLEEFLPLMSGDERKDLNTFASQNYDFHTYLISLAKNGKLLEIYQGLNIDVLGSRIYRIREAIRPASVVHAEHGAIVRGYEARDLSAVEEAITTHLITARGSHSEAFAKVSKTR